MGQTIMATLKAVQSETGQAWRMMLLSDQKQTSVTEPAQDVALLKQAVAAYRLGDKGRARELLNAAAELNPDNPLIWLWRASVAASYKEAVSSLERVLELEPTNAKARQWMDKLQLARTEALRKAGIQVPEAETAEARPTLVQPEEKSTEVSLVRVDTEQPSQPNQSDEAPVDAEESIPSKAKAEEERDPLLDLLAEREEQTETKPSEKTEIDEQQAPTGESSSNDILGELLAGQQTAEPATVEKEADPIEEVKALPEPIQPKSERNSSSGTEDAFAWIQETGVAPESQPSTTARVEPTPGEEESLKARPETPVETEAELETAQPAGEDNVQSTPLVQAEDLACPICEQMWTETYRLCPGCGSLTDLSLVDEAPRHDGADRASLRAAAKRLEEELEATPTADAHRRAGLVYMNLRQSNDALAHLREAMRLDPSDQASRAAVVTLEKRQLILAVDDSKTIQRMIASVLEKESYRVAVAADGLQALARLDEEMPAVMLLDITMPRMDGYQVCKVVTGNDATKHIPVIMLSGKDGFFDKVRGKMVGASNYITKPFDPSALLKAISKQIPS